MYHSFMEDKDHFRWYALVECSDIIISGHDLLNGVQSDYAKSQFTTMNSKDEENIRRIARFLYFRISVHIELDIASGQDIFSV